MANSEPFAVTLEQYLRKTPGGLLLRNHIRFFTPDLFDWSNDHNPKIARHCIKCDGKGFYRTGYGSARHDKSCEDCGHVGGFEEPEAFFGFSRIKSAKPNEGGFVKCPSCQKSFPIGSNQFWTGLRHKCGQKIELNGPFAHFCWRRKYDADHGIVNPNARTPWWHFW